MNNVFLTKEQEIARLTKVLNEKNKLIEDFKIYDDKRKQEIALLIERNSFLEEYLNEFKQMIYDISSSKEEINVVNKLFKNNQGKSVQIKILAAKVESLLDKDRNCVGRLTEIKNTIKNGNMENAYNLLLKVIQYIEHDLPENLTNFN